MTSTVLRKENHSLNLESRWLNHFLEWAQDDTDLSIADAAKNILGKSSPEEVVAEAKDKLLSEHESLAHLLLGCHLSDPSEKLSHYDCVIRLTATGARKHLDTATEWMFELANVCSGLLLWSAGKHSEAIALLEAAAVDERQISQEMIDAIRFMLSTFLICEKAYERASNVLSGESANSAEWYYLNSLLKFIERGDDFISRGAASVAIADDSFDLVDLLIGTEYDAEEFEPESLSYAALTLPAWEATPGAQTWLKHVLEEEEPRLNCDKEIDSQKAKRIDDEVLAFYSHFKRDDTKSAKRSFLAALREADRLNDGGATFFRMLQLIGYFPKALRANDWGIERLDSRMKLVETQEAKGTLPKILIYSYQDLAKAYHDLYNEPKARICATRAFDYIQKNRESIDAFVELNVLTLLGNCATYRSDFEEVEKFARAAIHLREQVLNLRHSDLVEILQHLRQALHKLGKHEEERELAKRVYEIDVFSDNAEEFEDLEWCDFEDLLPDDIRQRIWWLGGDPMAVDD